MLAIFLLETAGRVVSWKTGAETIKGYTEREILGQHYAVFYPPTSRPAGTSKDYHQRARGAQHCVDV